MTTTMIPTETFSANQARVRLRSQGPHSWTASAKVEVTQTRGNPTVIDGHVIDDGVDRDAHVEMTLLCDEIPVALFETWLDDGDVLESVPWRETNLPYGMTVLQTREFATMTFEVDDAEELARDPRSFGVTRKDAPTIEMDMAMAQAIDETETALAIGPAEWSVTMLVGETPSEHEPQQPDTTDGVIHVEEVVNARTGECVMRHEERMAPDAKEGSLA